MTSVNPKLLIGLGLVIIFVAYLKIMNPNRKYSSIEYWQTATIANVADVPREALKIGNKNGGVLMWAAMGTDNPAILKKLVRRGAKINESDLIFKGTPLTGAAGYSKNPKIIEALIKLGADITKRVGNKETALMIAAQYNKNSGIIEKLVSVGAKVTNKNLQGRTALDLAMKNDNKTAINALKSIMKK